jgi:hypothetical protein
MDQTIVRVAEQLGFQAARIWPQVVMVTWITSLFWTIVDPLLICAAAIGIVRVWRYAWGAVARANNAYDEAVAVAGKGPYSSHVSRFDYDPSWVVITCIVAATAMFIGATAALIAFPDQLAGTLYPEARTVIRIAQGLK